MAATTCVTSNGVRSEAIPFKVASASCETRAGVASAASRVAWGGSSRPVTKVDWLPPIHVSPVLPDGQGGWRWNPAVYNALRELFENRLGGIRGQSVAQVAATVAATQAEVASTTSYAEQVSQYAQSIAATVTATAEVASNNSLTGAASIPPPGEAPTRLEAPGGDDEPDA